MLEFYHGGVFMSFKFFKRGLLLLLGILLFPSLGYAKTVTCTSTSNYTVGKNVYEGASVKCSEGDYSIFAITELNSGYVQNGYKAVEGKTYFMDIYWEGTIDRDSDKIIVDGKDQTDMAFDCEGGCHFSSKSVVAKVDTSSTPSTTPPKEETPKPDTSTTIVKKFYWVTFDVNGGNETIKQQSVEEGKTATKPENPTREGYIFGGWYLNDNEYNFSTKITKNITLKAKWNEDATGKKNVSFIRLSGLLAPYEGETLDTSVRVETFTSWTKEIFSVDIKWYRGTDKNKIDELVLTAENPKVEAGYYYQARLTLTPKTGYTLNNTKVYLNKKLITATKNDLSLEFASEVYGPIEKGKSAEPIIVIEDIFEHIASDETYENRSIYYTINAHDSDGDDVIVDGKDCITLSDSVNFKIENPVCVGGRMNLSGDARRDLISNRIGDIYLTSRASNPGTYSTIVTLTDEKGRTYTGTITIERGSEPLEVVNASSENGNLLVEFAGEAMKNWFVHVDELYNKDNGKQVYGDLFMDQLGDLVSISNIKVTSEDGEKTNGSFTVKILLSEEMKKYKTFTFVYVYDTESYRMGSGPETITGHVEGNYLVAKLPHLSAYAIYGNEVNSNNKLPIYIGIGIGIILIGVGTFIVIKKKNGSVE